LLAPLLDTEATRDETIVEGATLLGALALAARDPRRAAPVPPAFEARVRDELSALAADNRAALLLSGLLSLQERTGEAGRREGLAAIAAAAEAGMPLAQGLYGVLMLSEAFNVERLRVGLTPDPDRAMALLTAARRRGLALGPDTVALDTLEKRRRAQFVAHCQSRLDFDLRALLDPWNLRAGADVAEGLGRLPTLLRRALDGASLEGWRQACAEIDALDDVPGDLLLALAAMRARAGETDMAEALLARVEPDPFVAFVRASLLYGRDESEAMVRLSAAAREGHEGATLYLALLGSGRTEETERLRAEVRTLAEAGLPAAQFLQAVFEQRAREPFAAIRALVWAERAEAAGFTIGPRMMGQIRSTAAAVLERDLGFRLEALTPESRRRHGHTTYRGRGVLVAEIGEEGTAATGRSPLARGMIVDEVNRTALDSTVTTARRLMLEQLMESGRISGFVTRPGGGKALYLLQPPADLAAFLEERPESLGLRVLNSRPSTLRQGPGEAFTVLTDTRAGERVQLLSPLEGGWVRVRLTRDNALEGYLPHVAFAHN
ncbi:MAG: SH3 domain-containing protein, partial [Pseudomonadota bacterium]